MNYFPPLLLALSMCGGDGLTADLPAPGGRGPVLDLGALAGEPEPDGATVAPDAVETCAQATVGVTAIGPRIHDPQDPYTIMSITVQGTIPGEADADTDVRLCSYSCSLHTTDCWLVRQADDCESGPSLGEPPLDLGATTEVPNWVTLCIQATGASVLPLRETVTMTFNDSPSTPRSFIVSGPRP